MLIIYLSTICVCDSFVKIYEMVTVKQLPSIKSEQAYDQIKNKDLNIAQKRQN
jgi:hypothetical protein